MRVNQNGDPVVEERLFSFVGATHHDISDQDRDDAIALLAELMRVEIYRTNATKHGFTQLALRHL